MPFRFLDRTVSNVHAAALLLGAAGFLSRLLGLLRDRMLASYFGAGKELDIYYVAFQIPDFVAVLFLVGAGSAAILPRFQEYLFRDKKKAERFMADLLKSFLAASIATAAVVLFFTPLFMRIIAPGFSLEDVQLAATLTRIMLLSPILLGLSSIFSVSLQSFQRFFAFALAPVLYNIGIIAGILFFVPWWGVAGLAGGVVLGALLHFFLQYGVALRLGFGFSAEGGHADSGERRVSGLFNINVRSVARAAFPRVIALSITQIIFFVLVALGSTLAAGSIAIFTLAYNLYFVPVGIFGISYSIVLFPRLSRAFLLHDGKRFFEDFFWGIRTILFWIAPSAALFLVLRAHIVRVTLGAGRFSWEDTRLTAASLAILVIAMFGGGLSTLFIKGFYALENTWRPLFVSFISLVVSLGSAVGLIHLLRGKGGIFFVSLLRIADLPHREVLALASGFSIGIIIETVILFIMLISMARGKFSMNPSFPWLPLLKIFMAACGSGIAAYAVRSSFSAALPLITFFQVLAQGLLSGIAGMAVYIGILFFLKSEDLKILSDTLRRRLISIGMLPQSWDGDKIY